MKNINFLLLSIIQEWYMIEVFDGAVDFQIFTFFVSKSVLYIRKVKNDNRDLILFLDSSPIHRTEELKNF